ncbi:MAG: fructokinase [Burkholderiales bacterium]|nr:fructokinase [Burkholderiales bacterium]
MKELKDAPVIIFGEALVDEFAQTKVVGGAPLNVARNLSLLHAHPLMLTRLGQDENGALIREHMLQSGLSLAGLQIDAEHPSGQVRVTQNDLHDLAKHEFHILPDQAYDHVEVHAAQQAVTVFCGSAPKVILYFGTLAQRATQSRAALRNLLGRDGMLTYLDLNLRDGQFSDEVILFSLANADIVKLNEDELQYVLSLNPDLGSSNAAVQLSAKILSLLAHFDLQAMIVTLGEKGYLYVDRCGAVVSSAAAAKKLNVVDTVGAGDAFSAVFLAGLIGGWPLETTLARAHEFAGAVCGLRGAVATDKQFYATRLQQWQLEDLRLRGSEKYTGEAI